MNSWPGIFKPTVASNEIVSTSVTLTEEQIEWIIRAVCGDCTTMQSLASQIGLCEFADGCIHSCTIHEAGELYRISKRAIVKTLGANHYSKPPTDEQLLLAIRALPMTERSVMIEILFLNKTLVEVAKFLQVSTIDVFSAYQTAMYKLKTRFPAL